MGDCWSGLGPCATAVSAVGEWRPRRTLTALPRLEQPWHRDWARDGRLLEWAWPLCHGCFSRGRMATSPHLDGPATAGTAVAQRLGPGWEIVGVGLAPVPRLFQPWENGDLAAP